MFLIYQALYIHEAETVIEIVDIILREFDLHYSKEKVERLKKRVEEMDSNYLNTFFNEHIGDDLSYIWNNEKAEIYLNIKINTIKNCIEKENFIMTEVTNETIKELQLEVTKEFLENLKNKNK